MEDMIAQETGTEAVAATALPESEEERQLASEISELWATHLQAKTVAKKTKEELKVIRERLGERLYQMKQVLARPGRNGQWSGWLKERQISRATADRLVQQHAAALPGFESPHEAISNPPVDVAAKLAKVVWSRYKNVLATDELVVEFIASFAEISGVPHELCADGLMIFRPATKAVDELSGSASATDPAPQPADPAPTITEEPAAETAAGTSAMEQCR